MNKAIITLLVAMAFTAVNAKAQFAKHYLYQGSKDQQRYKHWQHTLNKTKYAARTTASDVRLISQGTSYYDGAALQLSDSISYTYSAGRNGTFDDMWLSWNWNYDAGVSYDHDGSSYEAYWKDVITYTPDNKMSTYISQEWNSTTSAWDNYSKDTFIYNTAGDLVKDTSYEWNTTAGTWDIKYGMSFTYNAAGKVITMLQQEWDGTIWDDLVNETYTWDAANKWIKWEVQFSFGSTWENAIRQHFSYDGAGNRTSSIEENWDGATWDTTKYTYSGFVTHQQPQTAISMRKNETTLLFENDNKINYSFNGYGKPVYEFEEKWDATTSTWAVDTYAYATRYHYEPYTSVGIDHISSSSVTAEVYPIPAAANMNVHVNWNEAQRYRATITDATGRLYMSWTSPMAAKTHRETVSVGELPPGNYVLTLQGDKARTVKQFTVMR